MVYAGDFFFVMRVEPTQFAHRCFAIINQVADTGDMRCSYPLCIASFLMMFKCSFCSHSPTLHIHCAAMLLRKVRPSIGESV